MRTFTDFSGNDQFWTEAIVLMRKYYNLKSLLFVSMDNSAVLPDLANGLLVNNKNKVTSLPALNVQKYEPLFEVLPADSTCRIKKSGLRSQLKNSVFFGMDFICPISINGRVELLICGTFKLASFDRFFNTLIFNASILSILKTEVSHRLSLYKHRNMLAQLSDAKRDFLFDYQARYSAHRKVSDADETQLKATQVYIQITQELNSILLSIKSALSEIKQSPIHAWAPLLKTIESECHQFERVILESDLT